MNAVREDPKQKGLLFAATERSVYISLDAGDHWQSLRLNLPASSMRDLEVKGDDLIVATHGRGFWILDDISALRQIAGKTTNVAVLFHPATALRVRWNTNTDTPLPPDEPTAENPPEGAILDYMLPASVNGPVTLEIRDASGNAIRHFSSEEPVPPTDPKLDIPQYWVRPPQELAATPGMHRFLWDMHLAPIAGIHAEYPIAAVPHETAPAPTSPWVQPGQYSVVLTAGGHSYTQALAIQMDPRVKTPAAALAQQFSLSQQLYEDARSLSEAANHAEALKKQVAELETKTGAPAAEIKAFGEKLEAVAGSEEHGPPRGGVPETLDGIRTAALMTMTLIQDADAAPTAGMTENATAVHALVPKVLARWQEFQRQELPQFNQHLKQANLPELNAEKRGADAEVDMRGNEE